MDGLFHQNQNGQLLEKHLILQKVIILAHLGLKITTGLLHRAILVMLTTLTLLIVVSADTVCTTFATFA